MLGNLSKFKRNWYLLYAQWFLFLSNWKKVPIWGCQRKCAKKVQLVWIISLYIESLWLSRGKGLARLYELCDEMKFFQMGKNISVSVTLFYVGIALWAMADDISLLLLHFKEIFPVFYFYTIFCKKTRNNITWHL